MCLLHKWGKWEQYERPLYSGGTMLRQRRKCEKCGKVQDEYVCFGTPGFEDSKLDKLVKDGYKLELDEYDPAPTTRSESPTRNQPHNVRRVWITIPPPGHWTKPGLLGHVWTNRRDAEDSLWAGKGDIIESEIPVNE